MVYIIDDDKIYRYVFERQLRKQDEQVTIAQFTNGATAFEAVQEASIKGKNIPSIIFLDLNMPIMNGWEFLDAFERIPESLQKQMHIFVVSSSINQKDMQNAKANPHVEDYLIKPVRPEQLKKILSAIPT